MVFASGPVPAADALAGERVGRRYAVQVAALGGLLSLGAGLAYGSLKIPLICPLRLVTGVPCPLCGMTTGTTAFVRGDLRGAAAANPFSILFVPAVVYMLADRVMRLVRGAGDVVVSPRARKLLLRTAVIAAAASWVFQLFRFDIIG